MMLLAGIGIGFVLFVLLAYLGGIFGVTLFSLRPPRIHQFVSPGALGYPQESFETTTEDGVIIRGWFVQGESDVVFVACHGYLVNRCEWVPTVTFLGQTGASFVFFDHRGQGRSGAAKVTLGPDESKDVDAVLDWLATHHPGKRVVLLGSSMGAVASTIAASRSPEKVDALILDGCFRNLDEASKAWWLFLGGKAAQRWLAPTVWIGPSLLGFSPKSVAIDQTISKLDGKPILIFSGTDDPIVPVPAAQALHKAAGSQARIVWFEGATHGAGRLNHSKQFEGEVMEFLTEHDLVKRPASLDASR